MSIKNCIDVKNNINTRAVFFNGTAQSINELQQLLSSSIQLNLNTLHTKIGWWAVKYEDNSILWKKSTCFENNFKILD